MKNRNMFICQLPIDKQKAIRSELKSYYDSVFHNEYNKEDINRIIDEVMSDRIYVLEEGLSYLLDELGI